MTEFAKLHGLGNDYIYLNAFTEQIEEYSLAELARILSDRHFGVGGDGIILIMPSETTDFRMRIFNSDGSEAEMCGNGIRGLAKYVYEQGMTDKTTITVETDAGVLRVALTVRNDLVAAATVDMGTPRLNRSEIPMLGEPANEPVIDQPLEVNGDSFNVTCVSMGNPHCVIFVDDVEHFTVADVGPLIENHELFPERINVEFVSVLGREHVKMRVWERGAGETLACGTGASASVVAGVLTDRTDRQVEVELLGGPLRIEWHEDEHVFMTGPITEVFTGQLNEQLIAPARK